MATCCPLKDPYDHIWVTAFLSSMATSKRTVMKAIWQERMLKSPLFTIVHINFPKPIQFVLNYYLNFRAVLSIVLHSEGLKKYRFLHIVQYFLFEFDPSFSDKYFASQLVVHILCVFMTSPAFQHKKKQADLKWIKNLVPPASLLALDRVKMNGVSVFVN